MKTTILYLKITILFALFVSACDLDNYDSPNASFFGAIIDEDTGQPILQDLIQGSEIDIVELGFETTTTQVLRFKTDGTFRNDAMFAGTYTVRPNRGNFFLLPEETIDIKGKTEHTFRTKPYIRIKDVDISFDEKRGKVNASFKLERLSDNAVDKVVLLTDLNPNVAMGMRTQTVTVNVARKVDADEVMTVSMPTMDLTSGKDYYFRVGALTAGISQAKHNYCEAVRLHIDNSNVVAVDEDPGVLFDGCESLTGWSSALKLSLDGNDKKEGDYSIMATGAGSGVVFFQKVYSTPFDTKLTKANGSMFLQFYISDISQMDLTKDGTIELTSSGKPDQNEFGWKFNKLDLTSGWNRLELKFADATVSNGEPDLSAINFIRIYHTGTTGDITFKIDNIRFF